MTGDRWATWLADEAATRRAVDLRRTLTPRPADDRTLDLAGNDYLGLAQHPEVVAAAVEAARRWGAGAGASRLVTGTLELHADLERDLAAALDQPAALAFSTGYHANLGGVAALADRQTLIVSDAHIHASLIDAARLARAPVQVVPHHDVAAVERALAAHDGRALVLAESIYSVLGDAAPLVELAETCARHGALLLVDEAHGLGVHGTGLVAAAGLAGRPEVIVTATLSKALGAQGGAVLGQPAIIDHLVNRARPFIFDTGLAPAAAGAARAALRIMLARPELAATVRERMAGLADLLEVAPSAGAVLSVPMPSAGAAVAARDAALAAGLRVGCFRPPSVPDGISRLRITVSAGVPEGDWTAATAVLRQVVGAHR